MNRPNHDLITRHMKTIRLFFLVIAAAGPIFLQAQQNDTASYSFTLQQSVDYALQHNTSVQNATLDQVAANNKVKEVIGIGLPQISSTFQVQDYLDIPTSLIPGEFFGGPPGSYIPVKFGTKYNASLGFSASQIVFSGSWFLGVKASQIYQDLAQKNVDRTRIETQADVTKAYYTVMVNQEKKLLIDANLAKLKKTKDDTKALFDNGFVEKIDLDRITVAYNNLVTEADNIKRLLDLSLVLLKYQMGMDQSAKLSITGKIQDLSFTPATLASGKFDYNNRVEYQSMDLLLRGQKKLLQAERVGYFPTIALFGSLQAQAQRTKFDFFDTQQHWYPISVIGLQVSIPIFDGLQRHYRVQQSRVEVLKAENNLLMIQRTIDMQQAVAKVNLQNSAASLESQKANMELAQQVLDVAEKKYSAGTGTNLEIINAQTALKEAQTNYFNALYDAIIAKVEYDKSMGVFTK
jgi:outer membrane protein TolC